MTKLLAVFLVVFLSLTAGLTGEEQVITSGSEHSGDIKIEKGNLKIERRADLICKKGILTMGSNNDFDGDVYAKELIRGFNNDINGAFHKTEEK